MKDVTAKFIEAFFESNKHLSGVREDVAEAFAILTEAYRNGNKVMICGNGGSASDSEHIVGELMKGFLLKRPVPDSDREVMAEACGGELGSYLCDHMQQGLPAISLVSHTALMTAFSNDVEPAMVFAQQVYGYKKEGDVLIGISTSGNSKNVYYALSVARAFHLKTIAMTGAKDSLLSGICDVTLRSTACETFKVQEDHLKLYHLLCGAVELELFER